MNRKISVIIAIYNVAEFLRTCLESVINQTYRNIEIICVNDGSTDACSEICEEYALLDQRIRIIHQSNQGKSAACNRALEVCKGEYISIIDGDDWLEPEMYSVLVEKIELQGDIDISVCGYYQDTAQESIAVMNRKAVPDTPIDMRKFLLYIYERDMYRGVASYFWNRIFKAKFFKDNLGAIRFDERLNVGEDVLAAAQCYMKANKIIYTERHCYHYRQHEKSLMHNMMARVKNLGSCMAYEKTINLFESENVDSNIIDMVKRFYVYHAGVLLEALYKNDKIEKREEYIILLRKKVKEYIDIYTITNRKNPERIKWIHDLLAKREF